MTRLNNYIYVSMISKLQVSVLIQINTHENTQVKNEMNGVLGRLCAHIG